MTNENAAETELLSVTGECAYCGEKTELVRDEQGFYDTCEECASIPSDYSERMSERRQMGFSNF